MILILITGIERDAFEFVYKRWKKLMLNKAYGILRDYDLAQDAVSEAFIRLYKNMHKLDDLESGKTAAFLVMIVRNISITMYNKRARVQTDDISTLEKADDYNLENSVISSLDTGELQKLIGGLSDELKTPFLLKYAYDYSLKEISKMMQISENNVAVRIHRAKNKLAALVQSSAIGSEP